MMPITREKSEMIASQKYGSRCVLLANIELGPLSAHPERWALLLSRVALPCATRA